ncbi:CD109 antigen-like [Pleurodeles waltl]|uniref:CD109 antigen-like n=1 Tax=Pleurodeles waltl TaxID=8319 RepID=UPI003709A8EC
MMHLPLPRACFVKHCLLYIVLVHTSTAGPSYIITAPAFLQPGVNATFAVHWFGANYSTVNVSAEIRPRDSNQQLAFGQKIFTNDSIGMLTLPATPQNVQQAVFDILLNGSAQNEQLFTNVFTIVLQPKRTHYFIELDKSLYKPREAVKIRVIGLHSDLKPFHGQVKMYIKDPSNNLIQQWLSLKTNLGVASLEFLLSDMPPFGTWTIDVRVEDFQTIKTFVVSDFVVPKFEVAVTTPIVYIVDKLENLTGQVTAKYRHGEPVRGNVTVTIFSAWWYAPSSINKTFEISGAANFSFSYVELQSIGVVHIPREVRSIQEYVYNPNLGQINFIVTVKESLTGLEVSERHVIYFGDSEYIILNDHSTLKPHLNTTVKIKVLRIDLKPLTKSEREKNVSVLVSQHNYGVFAKRSVEVFNLSTTPMTGPAYKQYIISENGEVNLNIQMLPSTTGISIEVRYQNVTHNIWRSVDWQETPASIQIMKSSSSMEVGTPFNVSVESSENVKEINYVVLSKGQVVAVGKKNTQIFTLTPEVSWAPLVVINVYYIHSSGYVISDKKSFSIKGIFKNKVALSWSKAQAKPAENVSLSISVTEPGSLVGLRVVEKGAYGDRITESQVTDEVRNGQEVQGWTITDGKIVSYPVESGENLLYIPEGLHRRNNVSNTWIWLEPNIRSGINTNLQATVPKSITTWFATAFVISEELGFGLTSVTAELQVFQEFYITLNLPYSVTRGEQFILEVVIYNQLGQTLEVTVTLDLSDSFEITGTYTAGAEPNLRKSSVPSHSERIVLFPIKPKQLGDITFTVKATSSAASDVATGKVLVKAEGIQQLYTESVLLQLAGTTSQTVTKNVSFTFPSNVVPGSQQAYVTVVGDILGPTVDGLESLIQMPYGCGEQNMINFCPNIYILKYLEATGQTTPTIKDKAINYMTAGYQRELTYKRHDGSFSAFGNSDSSGSSWLSSFVLRCFLQARPFISIDQAVLERIIMWLTQFQNTKTGEYTEPGRVIHTELQGGQNGAITLTAYILTALSEDVEYRRIYRIQVLKAIEFLEKKFQEGITSNYTLAVVTYALSLVNSTNASLALDQLNGRAERADGVMFWLSPAAGIASYWQPRSTEIEMAAYALLACGQLKRVNEGIPIMKWLSQQRSRLGGYSTTQDTIMALQALSEFAALYGSSNASLKVSVTGPGNFVPKLFQINSVNRLVLQKAEIPVFQPLAINVTALGSGLAFFQMNVAYNIMPSARRRRSVDGTETFALNITVEDDKNNLNRVKVQACTRYIPSVYGNESGMALMEVHYLSGFSLDNSISIENNLLKKVEPDNGKVNLYFDSISGTPVCVGVPMLRDAKVSSSREAMISIVDYYKPRTQVTRLYSSSVMKSISSCTFCGKDCSLCLPNVTTSGGHGGGGNSNGNNAATAVVLHFSAYMFFLVASLTHLSL